MIQPQKYEITYVYNDILEKIFLLIGFDKLSIRWVLDRFDKTIDEPLLRQWGDCFDFWKKVIRIL